MKSIIIHLDDEEHEKLTEIKGMRTWKEMLMISVKNKGDVDGEL